MINILSNSGVTLKLRINQNTINTNSGCYKVLLNRDNIDYVYTTPDVSTNKNNYSKLVLSEDFINSLEDGDYDLFISDLNDADNIQYRNVIRIYTELQDNKTYFYDYVSNSGISYFVPSGITLSDPLPPSVFNVLLDDGRAYLTWTSVNDAQYYEVFKSINNNEFYWVSNVYGLSLIDGYLLENNMHNYKVRSVNSNGYSEYSITKNIIY